MRRLRQELRVKRPSSSAKRDPADGKCRQCQEEADAVVVLREPLGHAPESLGEVAGEGDGRGQSVPEFRQKAHVASASEGPVAVLACGMKNHMYEELVSAEAGGRRK